MIAVREIEGTARTSSGSLRACLRDRRAPHTVRPRFLKRREIHRLQALYLEAALREERRNIPSQMQTFKQPLGDRIAPLLPAAYARVG